MAKVKIKVGRKLKVGGYASIEDALQHKGEWSDE